MKERNGSERISPSISIFRCSPPPINLPFLLLLLLLFSYAATRKSSINQPSPLVMAQEVSHPALEPLALNYLTFGFQTLANNLWAWITLLTAAAITFWETSSTTAASPPKEDLPPAPTTTTPPDHYQQSPTPTPIVDAADSIGSTKGKFTAYFDLIEEEEEEEDFEEEDGDVKQTWAEEYSWEAEMRLRMRTRMDLSWYSFQDLTVIDGNVVKMWEERR